MVLNDLEHFIGRRDSTRLQLGPDWNIIKCDFKSSCRYQLSLDCIADEENHHTGVYLVSEGPVDEGWGLHLEPGERVLSGNDEDDDGDLGGAEDVNHDLIGRWRWEVLAFDHQFGILLLDGMGKLFKDFSVPSGVTEHEPKGRSCKL